MAVIMHAPSRVWTAAHLPASGIFADFPRESLMRCQKPPLTRILIPIAIRIRPPKTEALPASRIPT